jgi:uncharacterized protein (TIGR01777 family)
MQDKILITGYNGALAQRLRFFLENDYELIYLTSNKKSVDNHSIYYWDVKNNYVDENALLGCSHIIHLCGFNIMNSWSKKNKEKMHSSRVDTANLLFDKCKSLGVNIKTFIGASAMGYYGLGVESDVDENSPLGEDWLAKLSFDWEAAANQFEKIGSRIVNLRISLMMDLNSGFLKVTLLPMRLGITSVFLPSNLAYSWIHIDDLCGFITYALRNQNIVGPFNMAAPNKQNQLEVIREIKKYIFKNALIFPIPLFLMKIILGGRSQVIKGGLYLKTDKLIDSGYKYKYPTISSFLKK